MIPFDAEHMAVNFPADRRVRLWIRPSILIEAGAVLAAFLVAAWIEIAVDGLPYIPPVPQIDPNNFAGPHGFPWWVRYCHFFNLLFVTMLIRSGLSILADHARLYFNDDCTPDSEWIRFTPIRSHAIAYGLQGTTPAIFHRSSARPAIINRLAGLPYPLWKYSPQG